MSGVVLLTCGHLSKLILDHSKHLTHSVIDSLRELVLVIDRQPSSQDLGNLGLQNLSAGQLGKRLFSQDCELLSSSRLVTELLCVRCGYGHASEDLLCVRLVLHIGNNVTRVHDGLVWILFETFQTSQIDHCLNHMQALKSTKQKAIINNHSVLFQLFKPFSILLD